MGDDLVEPGMRRDEPSFSFRTMDDGDARLIAAWHYCGEYAFYDWDRDPDDLAEILSEEKRNETYYSAIDGDGDLIGFFQVTIESGVATIGLGLRPDLTGHGFGLSFVLAGMQFASQRYSVERFCLHVAQFNQRAIRTYRKAGFQPVRTYRNWTNGRWYDFIEMAGRSASNSDSV